MKIKAIIFDVDGVLLKSTKILIGLYEKTCRKLGIRVPKPKELSSLWGRSFEELVKILWPDIDWNRFIQTFMKLAKNERITIPPVENAVDTLKKLKNLGFKFSVVTARRRDFTHEI
jgi:phosphoglycolate phosphatase-like HAD superfamily hydrolase